MKLGKKVAAIALVSSLALTSAFAFGPAKGNMRGDCMSNGDTPSMMGGNFKNGPHMKKGDRTMMFLRGLDLSLKQRHEIGILKAEQRLEMKKSFNPAYRQEELKKVFSKEGFDAKEYAKQRAEKSQKRVEIQAKYMEKIYNILTPEQKAQVVKNIENFEPMAFRK